MNIPTPRLSARLLAGVTAVLLTLCGPVVLAPQAATAATTGCTSTPFRSSAKTKAWFRLPAVVATGSGRVLAFAERRDNAKTTDRGNFDIVMRLSTDGGCHWGRLRTVHSDGGNTVSNPVPIYDASTGTVLLLSSVRITKTDTYKGLYVQRVTRTGSSWSKAVKVAATLHHGGLSGPGHGIVLTKGANAGRIIFAMGYKKGSAHATYGIYSDDHGRTWRVGYDRVAPKGVKLMEGTIAQLPNGKLIVSYRDGRYGKPGTTRYYAVSTNGGRSVGSYRKMGVKTTSVQGSLLQTTSGSSKLLFSSPSFVKTSNYTIRKEMRIFVSTNGGGKWRSGLRISSSRTPSAYSDLVQLDSKTVGILYETGKKTWRERIVFTRVSLAAIK